MDDLLQSEEQLSQWEAARAAGDSMPSDEKSEASQDYDSNVAERIDMLKAFSNDFNIGASITHQGTDPPTSEPFPTIVGYRFLSELGRGGMGRVYRAWHEELRREVAIKVIHGGPAVALDRIERFTREARILAKLGHENIVPIFDARLHHGPRYYVMELIEGGTLAQRKDELTGKPRDIAALMERVARAVHSAHMSGVLHRDLKPENILVDNDGRPHVSDFGLAKSLAYTSDKEDGDCQEGTVNGAHSTDSQLTNGLTKTGAIMGTPAYMAPEQFSGILNDVCCQTDVWAMGVMLYELLAGQRPFTVGVSEDFARAVRQDDPPLIGTIKPNCDLAMQAIVAACLQKSPQARYANAAELADDLQRWLDGDIPHVYVPSWPRRVKRFCHSKAFMIGLSLVMISSLFALAMSFRRPNPPPQPVPNPEAELRDMEADLRAGKPVVWIKDVGPPRYSRVALGKGQVSQMPDPDKCFQVETLRTALIELCRTPPPSYTFRADVRHDAGSNVGTVGLYVDYRLFDGNENQPLWSSIEFADLGETAKSFANANDKGIRGNRTRISLQTLRQRDQAEPSVKPTDIAVGPFRTVPPNTPGSGPWRTLKVQVDPEYIKIFWDDEQHEHFSASLTQIQKAYPRLGKSFQPPLAFRYEPAVRGALGLYVQNSGALVSKRRADAAFDEVIL